VHCPNCGFVVHDPAAAPTGPVPIHYGDRILVLKYAYLGRDPSRWDVVVFKSPDDPSPGSGVVHDELHQAARRHAGETLMILDGDVYVSNAAAPDRFEVQGKPKHVQDALWRIVYDGEFLPRTQPWQPWVVESGGGWDLGTPERPRRDYAFRGAPDGAAGTIRFDAAGVQRPRAFTDWLAYAQFDSGHHNVSDLKLGFLYDRTAGDGPLRVSLRKHDETFTAELTPAAPACFAGPALASARHRAPARPTSVS
jgi:hypothetical protein